LKFDARIVKSVRSTTRSRLASAARMKQSTLASLDNACPDGSLTAAAGKLAR